MEVTAGLSLSKFNVNKNATVVLAIGVQRIGYYFSKSVYINANIHEYNSIEVFSASILWLN
ncbi:MAG: hypothetical protein IPM71_14630 [Bacteroidota bacterium]|nr:MAG: hypothetical protein IPM71_14630 [Bacteroidota bacterium]